MTRIAFTADLHCDDYGSKIDPATGLNARWVDTVEMARWVANDARERGADLFIVGGDFTEQRHPAPWRVAQIGEALAAFNGPTLFFRGNHDGSRGGRSIVELLAAQVDASGDPLAIGIGLDTPDVRQFPYLHGGETAIAAIPYLDRHQLRALEGNEQLPESAITAALGDAYLAIARGLYVRAKDAGHDSVVLVCHQALAGGLMSDSQAAFLGDQGLVVDTRALAAIGFDAILAGHFHKHQVLSTEPLIAYAGAPYRTDFGEEHQEKGYLIVDVEPGKATMEFVPTPARRFVTIPGDLICEPWEDHVQDAIVRVIDLAPDVDVGAVRRRFDDVAFDVREIRPRPVDRPQVAGGMAEGLTASEALVEYFVDDDDAEQLVERGRGILAEVAG